MSSQTLSVPNEPQELMSPHRMESDSDDEDYNEDQKAMLARRRLRNPSYMHLFVDEKEQQRPIEEHGIIGDMSSIALVATDASIVWYCYPQFDSPSIFNRLLDNERGGSWIIRPAVEQSESISAQPASFVYKQLYHSETNVLISRFFSDAGVAQVTDYMPISTEGIRSKAVGHGWIVRELEVIRGKMYFEVICTPAFNDAQSKHSVEILPHGVKFKSDTMTMMLTTGRKRLWLPHRSSNSVNTCGPGAITKVKLLEGQKTVFVLRELKSDTAIQLPPQTALESKTSASTAIQLRADPLAHPSLSFTENLRLNTMQFWRTWLSQCTYQGRWRESVYRAALSLKLMCFEETGAIVAACTTSLPQKLGQSLQFDGRLSHVRDSTFVVNSFVKLGFKAEAEAYMTFISKRVAESKGRIQKVYGIRGETSITARKLDHLSGYKNSRPVVVGLQIDSALNLASYGELINAIHLSNQIAQPISFNFWSQVKEMVEFVIQHWQEPDVGIWGDHEQSGKIPKLRHYVYSKVMSWVALDRGIKLAQNRGFPADLSRWRTVRDQVYTDIMSKGYSKKRRCFVQSYGSSQLDASCLLFPSLEFISPTDPAFISSVDQCLAGVHEDGLMSNNLIYRSSIERPNADSVRPSPKVQSRTHSPKSSVESSLIRQSVSTINENEIYSGDHATPENECSTIDEILDESVTFNNCTFYAVEALARIGMWKKDYLEQSRLIFEQMLGYSNHLGLYSESMGKRGEHLGNFPHAATLFSLVTAAVKLDEALGNGQKREPQPYQSL